MCAQCGTQVLRPATHGLWGIPNIFAEDLLLSCPFRRPASVVVPLRLLSPPYASYTLQPRPKIEKWEPEGGSSALVAPVMHTSRPPRPGGWMPVASAGRLTHVATHAHGHDGANTLQPRCKHSSACALWLTIQPAAKCHHSACHWALPLHLTGLSDESCSFTCHYACTGSMVSTRP